MSLVLRFPVAASLPRAGHLRSSSERHSAAQSFSEQLPVGRLIEIAGGAAGAQMSLALSCLRHAQTLGEPTAWIQLVGGPLYPPDLNESGIDLATLLVVNVPRQTRAHARMHAAESLLRSGSFGLLVIDLSDLLESSASVWQGRLLGLARQQECSVLLLSDSARKASFGPLISLWMFPQRIRSEDGGFCIAHHVLKDKSGLLSAVRDETYRGCNGLSLRPSDYRRGSARSVESALAGAGRFV